MSQKGVFLLLLCWAGLSMPWHDATAAKQDDSQWSFSPLLGIHAPSLKVMNEGMFVAPLKYNAEILQGDTTLPLSGQLFRNPLPPINYAPLTGIEFQWQMNPKHAFLIGGSTWEGASEATVSGQFPMQGAMSPTVNDRRAKLSYNDFFFGWKYNAISRPDKYNLYFRMSLHEIFDIDYREDWVFNFPQGRPDERGQPTPFRRIFIIQSQATGMLMLQPGFGVEVFLRKWLSLGFESSYTYSLKTFKLRNSSISRDFLPTDGLFLEVPVRPNPTEFEPLLRPDGTVVTNPNGTPVMVRAPDAEDGNLEYLAEDGSSYKRLRLSFDGWKALFKINIYY
ncbi:MAG: hypothetical protein ACOY4D_04065 [Pseudomonadota bacterium]